MRQQLTLQRLKNLRFKYHKCMVVYKDNELATSIVNCQVILRKHQLLLKSSNLKYQLKKISLSMPFFKLFFGFI